MILKLLKKLGLLVGYPALLGASGVWDCMRFMLSLVFALPHVMLWGRSHYASFWFAQSTIQVAHTKWYQAWQANSEVVGVHDLTKGAVANSSQAGIQSPSYTIAEPPIDTTENSSQLGKQKPASTIIELSNGIEKKPAPEIIGQQNETGFQGGMNQERSKKTKTSVPTGPSREDSSVTGGGKKMAHAWRFGNVEKSFKPVPLQERRRKMTEGGEESNDNYEEFPEHKTSFVGGVDKGKVR